MPQTQNRDNAGSLEALAAAHFKRKFTDAEKNLLKSAPQGAMADCGVPSKLPTDIDNDPSKAEAWGFDREIAADLIRWLCIDPEAKKRLDSAGIAIQRAKITGVLNLESAVVPFPIQLWYCAFTGDAYLIQVEIPRLDLQGSWTKSIAADGAVNKGGVFLNYGFHADGEVRLLGAQIGGSLECEGGSFHKPGGYALNADGVEVKGGVFLREGFHADGEVRLPGAQIGGDLDCSGGTFNKPGGEALSVERADVKGGVFLGADSQKRGFTANGAIDLWGTKIGGGLNLTGGDLLQAELALTGASAAGIRDDWSDSGPEPDCWPRVGKLHLDGFVYRRIDDGSRNPEDRLKWLELQPKRPFAAQPYLHLAEVLRAHGDDDGATRVMVAMEDRRRAASDYSSRPEKAASLAEGLVLKGTIGYGYQPLRAFPWILGPASVGFFIAEVISPVAWFPRRRMPTRRSRVMGTFRSTTRSSLGLFTRSKTRCR